MPMRNGIPMNEMAVPKSEYIDKVDSKSWQIVQHYCLTLYAKERGLDLYNHWKTELLGHFKSIRRLIPKSGDKRKIAHHEYIDAMELNDPKCVERAMENKLSEEHIDADFGKYYAQFAENIDLVIDCLADRLSIDEFAEKCNL